MRVKELNVYCSSRMSFKSKKNAICGTYIGSGQYRDVYMLKDNPRYVVKVEKGNDSSFFANITEWSNYIQYKDYTPIGKWLAPCYAISHDGKFLIQARVTKAKKFPKRMPSCFVDTKEENFGIYKGRFVCHDYSFISLKGAKIYMEEVEWWSIKDLYETGIYKTWRKSNYDRKGNKRIRR